MEKKHSWITYSIFGFVLFCGIYQLIVRPQVNQAVKDQYEEAGRTVITVTDRQSRTKTMRFRINQFDWFEVEKGTWVGSIDPDGVIPPGLGNIQLRETAKTGQLSRLEEAALRYGANLPKRVSVVIAKGSQSVDALNHYEKCKREFMNSKY